VLWKVAGSSGAAPAVADATVYFLKADHTVVALDVSTGAQRWQATAGEGSGWPRGTNVIVAGGNVIVPDEAVYAFDRTTGAQRWMFLPTSGDMPGRFHLSTDGVRVFTGSPAGFAYALDPATGTPIWTTELASDNISAVYSPVVDRGLVVVTLRHFTNPATGGVVALDAATGAVRWRRDFPTTGPGRGSGSQGRAGLWQNLVIAPSDDGTIYAMDRADGTIVWISPRPDDEGGYDDQRPVMVVGDVVVVGSDRPVITGLDAASGAERWRIPSAYGSVSYEMGSDGSRAYVLYAGLQLSAIDPVAGRIVWTVGSPPGEFLSYPTIDGDRVFVGAFAGLFALRR
jgi:outer membrane protein assembly factor BamB